MPVQRPIQRCLCTNPNGVFGLQVQPMFAKSFQFADIGATNTYQTSGLRFDSNLRLLYPIPVYINHAQRQISQGAGQEVLWTLNYDPTLVSYAESDRAPYRLEMGRIQGGWGTYVQGQTCSFGGDTVCQSAWVEYEFAPPDSAATDSSTQSFLEFVFWLGQTYAYTVRIEAGKEITLWRTGDAGQTWVQHKYQQSTEAVNDQVKSGAYHLSAFTVTYFNQRLVISLGGNVVPAVLDVPKDTDTQFISVVSFGSQNFQNLKVAVHPHKWTASSWVIPNEENVGFVPDQSTPPQFTFDAIGLDDGQGNNPSGSTVYAWIPDGGQMGTDIRFKLDIENPVAGGFKSTSWSHRTCAIRQVTMAIPGISLFTPSVTENLSNRYNPALMRNADYVRNIEITHQFDWNNLNIYSQASLHLSNRHGEWQDYGGLTALSIELGWVGSGYMQQFTGYGGIKHTFDRETAPESMYSMTGQDLSYCCRTSESFNLPWMDGWCHYFAIRFLAQMAGIDESRLSYLPACQSADCGNPDHYRLPMGEGGSPLMEFGKGTPYWAVMNRIRRIVGYIMYFDVYGYLQYYPWVRTQPGTFKASFDEIPNASNYMRTLEQLQLVRDVDQVYNHLTIIGIDAYAPLWRPTIAHRADEESMVNYGARNFVPFRKRAVWADSQFATMQYASDAADAIFAVIDLPGEWVTFKCIGQPDIYPLDVIHINEYKTGADQFQGEYRDFFVTQVTQRMTINTKMDYSTTITGRWLV